MRRTLNLALLSGCNVLISFATQWYVFTRIGPGWQTDAFFAGMVVPTLVLAVVSGSLTYVLVPLLSASEKESFGRDGWTFFQGVGLIFGLAAIVLGMTAPVWVGWTVPGFSTQALDLTVFLVRIQLVGMVFTACTGVLWAANHARGRFVLAEASPVVAAVITFPLLVIGIPRVGIAAAAWVIALKFLLQMLLLLPVLGRYRLPAPGTDVAREAWRRIRPLLLGSSFYKTDQFVDRYLASMAPAGGLSLLHLAQQLYAAGHQVMNAAIAAPLVPRLSSAAHSGDAVEFERIWKRGERVILLLTLSVFAGLLLIGRPVLGWLLAHGEFGPEQVDRLWLLAVALGGTWLGGALGQIFAGAFYSRGDTLTPTRVGVVGFVIGIGLKIFGFLQLGVLGIALGTSCYVMLNAIVLRFLLSRTSKRSTGRRTLEIDQIACEHP